MYSIESTLKVEILNAIRAAGSAKTGVDTDRVVKRYASVVRRAHLFGYDVSAITFGDAHQPAAVWLKHSPVCSDRRDHRDLRYGAQGILRARVSSSSDN